MFRKLARIIYPSPPRPDAAPGPADPVPPSSSTSPSPPPPSAANRRLAATSASANSDTDLTDPSRAASSSRRPPASPTSTSTRPDGTARNKRKADDHAASSTTTNKRSRSRHKSLEPVPSRKRTDKVRSESPDDATDSHGHDDGPMTKAVARRFDAQGPGAGNYKRMTGPAFAAPIYLGDVVEMRSDSSSTGGGGWYGCVELIRALKHSVTKIRDRDPDKEGDLPQYLSTEVGLQLSWFYTKSDLEALKGEAAKACKGATAVLGPTERVKGDCKDWNWQTMIVSKRPELMYVFNDSFPRRAPLKYTIAWHPLRHYSTRDLRKVAPSTRHFPALETPSRFPDDLPPLPAYYFGVGYPGYEGPEVRPARQDGHAVGGEPLASEGDGVRQIPYVRVGFSFLQQQAEEDDEVAATAAGKKAKARGGGKWVHKLEFNTFSAFDSAWAEGSPYNPRKVQHYARTGQWYNVDDLYERGHFRWKYASTATEPAPAAPPAPATPKPAPYPPVTPQRRRPARPAFTIEIPAPRTPSSRMPRRPAAAVVASSSWSSSPAPPRDDRYLPPAPGTPPPAYYAADAFFDNDEYPIAKLHQLARSNMVRGGAYGLIGNAYLVDHATWLAHELRLGDGDNDELSPEAREELWDDARNLLDNADEWADEVRRRVRGDGGAATLAPEWRSTGDEQLGRLLGPDDGEEGEWVWVSPTTHQEI
ncbi:hypothetical protein JCM8208_005064 [Rhodotorula glutinis]